MSTLWHTIKASSRAATIAVGLALGLSMLAGSVANAHIGVLPGDVPADSSQVFTVRVPNERPEATVKVRVEVPAGLVVARFQVRPGWVREIERDAEQRIVAVTWSGGQIADAEYEDFAFQARTPKEAGTLMFKSYQTYASGETVAWVNDRGQERSGAFVEVRPPASGADLDEPVEGVDALWEPAEQA